MNPSTGEICKFSLFSGLDVGFEGSMPRMRG